MREIKFRGWSNGQMTYSEPMPDFSFWKWVGYDSGTVLMQYTGLKDKNGKEIYEGDICRYHSPVRTEYDLYFSVRWDGEKARFGEDVTGSISDGSFIRSGKSEVIGNIYEHSDLLK